MRMRSLVPLLSLLLMAGCINNSSPTTTSLPSTTAEVTTTRVNATTSTTVVQSTTTAAGGCGPDHQGIEGGEVTSVPASSPDAAQVGAITWETTPECERFTIELLTGEGDPAAASPAMSAEFIRSSGVLRIFLDLEVTTTTDELVESTLVDRLYVARPLREDRSLFIDFHLAAPATASIGVTESPGAVTVTLEPGGAEYEWTAAFADNVVLVSPATGPVEVPVELSGYSRNFEANTIGRISQDGTVLAEDFTTAADWVETWGEFELSLESSGSGVAELFVGEQSAQDGSDRGVVLDIELP